ncbi:Glycosyltransferase involved in cell wall bisynthesis [Paenibacillus uliginis N3/975]|uniref:Glycosyltransferase involved in cell wall bisynthesis n=1 Tax=Paenibacillus uliginis N3/975 TaxID=1313296 RepID=A0A1X7HD76_9BACL|nr:glycosyltransferase family 4 protein [Paenibacillus uliginis]SMF84276.1 Glycosyltransferase involved in cell wall bisynthesis [Paenibacillus uliginis N3/975]
MRLLIIAPEEIPVPPPVGGSVEHCIYHIAGQFSSSVHSVTIISRWKNGYPRTSTFDHVTIHRVNGTSSKPYLSQVIRKVKNRKFDLIQIDNRPKFVPAIRREFPHTPISVFLHSTTFISPPMTSISQANKDFNGADLLIGNSLSLQEHLKKKFPKHSSKVHFVHLGVDLGQFHPSSRNNSGTRPFTVIFAGRLIPKKGIPVIIRAMRKVRQSIPSARLVIAGGTGKSEYKRYLKKLSVSLGVPTTFKGYVARSKMPAFYNLGDCFVCPSQGHEAFGLVNVEAMASGVPVVASRNGGIPEIINHRHNGLLVTDYRNPEAFAKEIFAVATDREFAARLAKQAREDALQNFSWRKTAKKLESIYASEIRTRRSV